MLAASEATSPPDRPDETLLGLVPRPSVVRSSVLAVVVAVLLTCAYVVPDFVRPVVVFGGGSAEVWDLSRAVLVDAHLTLTSRGDVQLVGVSPAPGARLVDAWVLPAGELERMYTAPPIQLRDPLDTLETRYRGEVPLDDLRLPQPFVAGTTQHLVLLWEITDCLALQADFQPELTVRTAVGTTERLPLDPFAGPAMDPEWLGEIGVCAAVSTTGSAFFP